MNESKLTILEREPCIYTSTFFNEIVTCRLVDGRVRRLLLKRGGIHTDPTYGHKGGVPYEAQVYRSVLAPLSLSTPSVHSTQTEQETGETTLLIDYVEGSRRLNSPATLRAAATWIGTFHRLNESRMTELADIIKSYDEFYYLGWVRRTLDFARTLDYAWLPAVARYFELHAIELVEAPVTVIHGEYYPHNILIRDGSIIPIDWESAAFGAGEIDLVSLTEGWSEEDKLACHQEYQQARWPGGAPDEFPQRLVLAEMYFKFRWLGDRPEWVTYENSRVPVSTASDARLLTAATRFGELQRMAQRLGII